MRQGEKGGRRVAAGGAGAGDVPEAASHGRAGSAGGRGTASASAEGGGRRTLDPGRLRSDWRWWVALGVYVAALYTILPYGPSLGLGVARTAAGAWLLGRGLVLLGVLGAVLLGRRLQRRAAPPSAWGAVVLVAVIAGVTLGRLRAARLERTHLPEYGVAAFLAWRAVAPLVPGRVAGYVAAAAVGAAIGWCDELIQGATPGRHYDLRDVGLNALGAVLGVVLLAAARTGKEPGERRER
jgi:hypothetical protein